MSGSGTDILMITHRRARYTEQSLDALLTGCDETMRVWIWHNGNDAATLRVVQQRLGHPRIHEFHHSPKNRRLDEPTRWLWRNACGDYLSKIDDDCLLSPGWAATLRQAHEAVPELGVVGCWRFQDEDFVPRLARRKIVDLPGAHRLLRNCWVEGSGYLMKRACVRRLGTLRPGWSFT
ncbi:MAG: glycosyltransferase, partial [Planctomycetota bacterium]